MKHLNLFRMITFSLSLSLAVALSGCADDDGGSKRKKRGDGDNVTTPGKPTPDPDKDKDKLNKLRSRNGSLVSEGEVGLGAGTHTGSGFGGGSGGSQESGSSTGSGELEIVMPSNPRQSGAIFQGNYGLANSTYSFSQRANYDYNLEVVEPDGNYIHCDPQDRNNADKCPVTWEPYNTGGTDVDADTREKYFDFTDFQDDLVIYRLREIAKTWQNQLGDQDFVESSKEFSSAIHYTYVTTFKGSNRVELRISIEDKNQVMHNILFTGNINGKRATLAQVERPLADKGYSYQAYLTCLDQMPGSCETTVVVIEQINSKNVICNRAIGVSRVMDAQLRIPDTLMRDVNCGVYQGGPESKRFLSYIANTAHNRLLQEGQAFEAHCIYQGSQWKVPYMQYIQARSFAYANGYSFFQVEGIESEYKGRDPLSYPPESRYIFDGNVRDWFRFSGDLKRSVDNAPKPNVNSILVEGGQMLHGDQKALNGSQSGMLPSVTAIRHANLVGNDGRGWISIDVAFHDGRVEEVEFRGLGAKIFSPEGMRFFPYQGVQPQPVTQYPVPFVDTP